ncbi:MAG: ATP-binding cassette domain-containing protein, partial [Flavobacteriales bacterium]|nr:ATP-binding cassette domain-containing protein [Flavobacteriales bacterium]
QTIDFHRRFKPLRAGLGVQDVARIAYLEQALEKPVQHFSSGMKQRLKLALAILSDTPLLLLDEPGSNLDADAVAWFRARVHEHGRPHRCGGEQTGTERVTSAHRLWKWAA